MRKKIEDYDNYFIYDNGDVLNTSTNKILQGSIGENGYKYYRLSKNNTKQMFYAHRLVAQYFLDNPNNLPIVNHKDGNKLNNNVDNLEWVTNSDNAVHAYEKQLIKLRSVAEYYKEDLMGELWKNIPNYHYSVSSKGRVRNDKTGLLLKPSITCGYYKVRLSQNGVIQDWTVHKLVYCTFYEVDNIPSGYVIDHKDANKLNNELDNLQLVTLSENVMNALYKTKTNPNAKAVIQLTLDDKVIQEFESCAEAARVLNLDRSTIAKVCRGQNKSHGGFHFQYK